jgi:hypothetical protein
MHELSFTHSNNEIVGSNSTRGMNICMHLFCTYNGVHSASWVQLRSYFEEKVEAQV